MAWMPETRSLRTFCKTTMLLSVILVMSGCEVGRTMFQHSSGQSSPWLGIDLIPRKKKVSSTNQMEPNLVKETSTKTASLSLAKQEIDSSDKFKRKPIRLNLPTSRTELKPTELTESEDIDFKVSSMRSRQF
ncbi:hypothetical protein [Rubinisphaera sp.]|uniref:hypothetical protein n=1 Tax=Rubinisphaera sp. TaxID=2024857 RepID=UPI000C11CC83|nr:hypothetical protein [Rubinisphaera sp.]MBV12226.1 hypothetical protein [Rubinisphaera sp.]HCS52001.1 hypothetical protein [Planctomycetaceae bacterium]|tara:strand:- start:128 stop:523 length:396 start_codon:yes stop_codon:yes gene_type:complete